MKLLVVKTRVGGEDVNPLPPPQASLGLTWFKNPNF